MEMGKISALCVAGIHLLILLLIYHENLLKLSVHGLLEVQSCAKMIN